MFFFLCFYVFVFLLCFAVPWCIAILLLATNLRSMRLLKRAIPISAVALDPMVARLVVWVENAWCRLIVLMLNASKWIAPLEHGAALVARMVLVCRWAQNRWRAPRRIHANTRHAH